MLSMVRSRQPSLSVPTSLRQEHFFDLNPLTAGTGLDLHFEFAGVGSEVVTVRSVSDAQGFVGFVGVIADMPIERMVIFEGDQTNLGTYEFYFGDDLVFSTSPVAVPEPTSIALAGLTVLGGIGLRWRQLL